MSWEDKFSSIVKETESNLARVRDRLGSSRVVRATRISYTSPTRDPGSVLPKCSSGISHSMENLRPRATMFSSPRKSSFSPSKSLGGLENPQRTGGLESPQRTLGTGVNQNTNSSSPALLNLLYERMEQQSEMVESLSKTVKLLEKDRNTQAEMISSLQSQVVKLNDRLKEQGVDLETERKLEQFKREVYSHLERIQSQYRLHDGSDGSHGDPSITTVAKDLQENKRLLHEDCESLRREVDHIKTRIGKIELETHSTMVDTRDTCRRLERIDRTVTAVSDNQRSQSHSLESMVDERDRRTFELGTLREKVDELSRQVSDWESDSQGRRKQQTGRSGSSSSSSKAHSQNKPRPKPKGKNTLVNGHSSSLAPRKSKRTTKAPELNISLSDSDLDMSTAFLGLTSDDEVDSDLISVQLNSYPVATNPEISDLSSASLSSLNSDELLAL